jgi:hypothetical protein
VADRSCAPIVTMHDDPRRRDSHRDRAIEFINGGDLEGDAFTPHPTIAYDTQFFESVTRRGRRRQRPGHQFWRAPYDIVAGPSHRPSTEHGSRQTLVQQARANRLPRRRRYRGVPRERPEESPPATSK